MNDRKVWFRFDRPLGDAAEIALDAPAAAKAVVLVGASDGTAHLFCGTVEGARALFADLAADGFEPQLAVRS
jgi:hypothetical protein